MKNSKQCKVKFDQYLDTDKTTQRSKYRESISDRLNPFDSDWI